MDPNLFMKFYHLQSNLGLRTAQIDVICGYRSAATIPYAVDKVGT